MWNSRRKKKRENRSNASNRLVSSILVHLFYSCKTWKSFLLSSYFSCLTTSLVTSNTLPKIDHREVRFFRSSFRVNTRVMWVRTAVARMKRVRELIQHMALLSRLFIFRHVTQSRAVNNVSTCDASIFCVEDKKRLKVARVAPSGQNRVIGLAITTLPRDFRKWAYSKNEPERDCVRNKAYL